MGDEWRAKQGVHGRAVDWRSSRSLSALKRAEDLVLATIFLLFAAPAMAAIALLIKLDSRGPVLFRQPRLGLNNQVFSILKFRTMYVHLSDLHARHQTTRNDPRVTRLGRLLRRMSLDELPQLLNVLGGSMSLVGPRPHALQTTVGGVPLAEAVPHYALRYDVKPGITGLAQVNGVRGELDSMEKATRRVDYDLQYIREASLTFDLRILWRTLRLVLADIHAY